MTPFSQTELREINTLDLMHLGVPQTIAAYFIPHKQGGVLVECGPGSTIETLTNSLAVLGIQPEDISDVLLTHIHLDHGGSAGWWARKGARIHVHPVGAPHLVDPERLLKSATRIYGQRMEQLWGSFLPVPVDKIITHEDLEIFDIEGLVFQALDTPGHAYHHFVYLHNGIAFTGDIGGVRIGKTPHLRLPMPPPEFNLELWKQSIKKLSTFLSNNAFNRIALTHFGIIKDTSWHLKSLSDSLDEVEGWIIKTMADNPSPEILNKAFLDWTEEQAQKNGLTEEEIRALEVANPSWMSGPGIYRYYQKKMQQSIGG